MNRARDLLKADVPFRHGITGKGITIAIMDTGIYPYHGDFMDSSGKSRIKGFLDFIRYGSNPPFKSWDNSYDDNGHGTHIAGIAAGSGRVSNGLYRGIAPESSILMLKVLDSKGNGNMEHVLPALEWLLLHQYDFSINVVNISVGTRIPKYTREDSQLIQLVNQVWRQGMVVVAAAGNDGPSDYSIGAPGISRKIITVGSSDDYQPSPRGGLLSNYSSRGPTESCVKKPDIIAPGSGIISCSRPQHSLFFNSSYPSFGGNYIQKSGTSMSTPMISGAAALLLSKRPFLSPKEVKYAFKNSARDLGMSHKYQGWGLLDLSNLFSGISL